MDNAVAFSVGKPVHVGRWNMGVKRIIACRISRGGFSGERIIEVSAANYKGLAPTQLCWNVNREPLSPDEPDENEAIEGFVAAHLMNREGNRVLISVPDGSIFVVPEDMTFKRPEMPSDVLV